MKKLLTGLILFPLVAFGAPQQPPYGGTGVSNCPSCTLTVNAPVTVSSSTTSAFDIVSSTQGARPWPSLNDTIISGIASPATALHAYNTTYNVDQYWDGSQYQTLLTLDNLLAGDNITIVNNGDGTETISSSGTPFSVGGSAYFNIVGGATTSFSNASPLPLNFTVNTSQSTDMTVGSDGSITAGSDGTYLFSASISGRPSSTANVFYFYFAVNGTVDYNSLQSISFPNGTPGNAGNQANILAQYSLTAGDVVRIYVANSGSLSNSFVTQTMSVSASQNLASSATLQSAYNNGSTITVANLNPMTFQNGLGSKVDFTSDVTDNFFNVQSTTQGSIPAPVMITTQWNAITPTDAGLMAFTSDNGRLNVFDGSDRQVFAYEADLPVAEGGAFVPSLIATSGISGTPSVNSAFWVQVGSMVTVTLDVNVDSSSSNMILSFVPPVAGFFSASDQASLMGQSFTDETSPTVADGKVIVCNSNAGTQNIDCKFLSAISSGTKEAVFSVVYQVQ